MERGKPGALAHYVLRLAHEPEEVAKLKAGPESARAAMTAAGLSPEHQEILMSRDRYRIAKAIADEFPKPKSGAPMMIDVSIISDPFP